MEVAGIYWRDFGDIIYIFFFKFHLCFKLAWHLEAISSTFYGRTLYPLEIPSLVFLPHDPPNPALITILETLSHIQKKTAIIEILCYHISNIIPCCRLMKVRRVNLQKDCNTNSERLKSSKSKCNPRLAVFTKAADCGISKFNLRNHSLGFVSTGDKAYNLIYRLN